MRKLPLFLLLATVASPALAQDNDHRGRHQRGQQAEQSDNRSERARPQRSQVREERRANPQRAERSGDNDRGMFQQVRERMEQRRQQTVADQRRGSGNGREFERRDRRGDRDGATSPTNWRERERHVRTIPETNPVATPQHREGRYDRRDRRDYRDGNYRRWSRDWHRNNRYDWRRYRDRNRSTFRLGFYYDPFGWNYRRWSIGSFMYPSYYGSRYWLNDPWQYRLPPAYGPYRWVRYWDDALLVNIYTGQVVDVIHNFFW